MSCRALVGVATLLATITLADAHGGLIIPPCRNNRGNTDIFNFTKPIGEQWLAGGSCAVSHAHTLLLAAGGVRNNITASWLDEDVACHTQ